MNDVLTMIEAMRDAGCDDATILKAIESAERKRAAHAAAEAEERTATRREKDRLRKRRHRSSQRVEIIDSASAVSEWTGWDDMDSADSADPSPHTPLPESISTPKKTPKGVQKGPKLDPEELERHFERIWELLPPNAARKGEEACRMAFRRAVASGADPGHIEAAVNPWLEQSGNKTERFDNWVIGGLWKVWLPKDGTATDWAGEVRLFQEFGDWRPDGPPPDKPGCRAPPDVLEAAGYPQLRSIAGGMS